MHQVFFVISYDFIPGNTGHLEVSGSCIFNSFLS